MNPPLSEADVLEALNKCGLKKTSKRIAKFLTSIKMTITDANTQLFESLFKGGYFGRHCATYFGHVVPVISEVIVPFQVNKLPVNSAAIVPLSIMMRSLAIKKRDGWTKNRHYGTTTTHSIKTQRP